MLLETRQRIAKSKGIDYASDLITWGMELPQLSSTDHLNDLGDILREYKFEVAIIDPLYLCLLAGSDSDKAAASNYYEMGPLFHQITQSCLMAGATPILTPHAKKHAPTDRPIELDDLAFAGIGEYCRQWLLLNRRERFRGNGQHRLHMSIGGSAGQCFFGQLDVNEGIQDEHLRGRVWEVSVSTTVEIRDEKQVGRDQKKAEQDQADDMNVATVIDRLTEARRPATMTRIRELARMSDARSARAVDRLVNSLKLFRERPAEVPGGNGARQKTVVYERQPVA